jgi:hypothetical protein
LGGFAYHHPISFRELGGWDARLVGHPIIQMMIVFLPVEREGQGFSK